MKEVYKSAIAVFNEKDELLRVDVFNEIKYPETLINAKSYTGADFKPAPVVLEVHGSNLKPKSKF